MSSRPLGGERVAALRAAPLTYEEVGGTSRSVLPPGYHVVEGSRTVVGRGFDEAAALLMTWQVPVRAGLRVAPSAPRVALDEVVEMRLGLGPLAVRIPCRVVAVVDEPDRVGFAYGTLPGHPECGEELFLLERGAQGEPVFTIRAFSRPGTVLTKVGGPAARWFQRLMTRRYLRALDAAS
ncbi:unannotated protein [freshwater metagenome]|uniref:Unannotated protein n=1 Tax=freshwater metagenome TaxID=449393 RepID=A0A6J6TSH7_9ZZZZ|nr:DUF1990 family protein [Actinomycetota bacterium]